MDNNEYIKIISSIGSTLIRTTNNKIDVDNIGQLYIAQELLKEKCIKGRGSDNESFDLAKFIYVIRSSINCLFRDELSREIAQTKFYSQYKHLSDSLHVTEQTQGDVPIALAKNCQRDAIQIMIGAIIVQWFLVALEINNRNIKPKNEKSC